MKNIIFAIVLILILLLVVFGSIHEYNNPIKKNFPQSYSQKYDTYGTVLGD